MNDSKGNEFFCGFPPKPIILVSKGKTPSLSRLAFYWFGETIIENCWTDKLLVQLKKCCKSKWKYC